MAKVRCPFYGRHWVQPITHAGTHVCQAAHCDRCDRYFIMVHGGGTTAWGGYQGTISYYEATQAEYVVAKTADSKYIYDLSVNKELVKRTYWED